MKKNKLIKLIFVPLLLIFISGCGGGSSSSDEDSSKFTIDAGVDRTEVEGTEVVLSGSIKGSEKDVTDIKWEQLSGTPVDLKDSNKLNARFTAPKTLLETTLEFELTVSAGSQQTLKDKVIITVVEKNTDPIANIGPDRKGALASDIPNPKNSEIIFIDGTQCSGNKFTWQVVSAPENSQYFFTSKNTPSTGFYADKSGEYKLKLTADNGQGITAEDEILITLIQDSDGDGIADKDDLDRDGDGFLNINDAFPDDRASHFDFNNDGKGNYYDDDVDGDGVIDIEDDYPLDSTRSKYKEYKEQEKTPFNTNDGISVSEDAGEIPVKISGLIHSPKGPDLDYYKIKMAPGIYSAMVDGGDSEMSPSVAIVDSYGNSLPLKRYDFTTQVGITGAGVSVPSQGDYYLVITDSSGKSDEKWEYEAKVFKDTDMDGLSDDLEMAIDSNHLSADSDGDTIPDFIEFYITAKDWPKNKDIDNDGLPAWWDTDTDGDMIPDRVEYYTQAEKPELDSAALALLNDVDGDGYPNFFDTSSDNTSYADDTVQAGPNPNLPLDTDKDGIPNYLDLDNDNDGLKDSEETIETYNVKLIAPGADRSAIADSLLIKRLYNATRGIENLSIADDELSLEIVNGPGSADELIGVFNTLEGAITQKASSLINNIATFTGPDNIDSGLIEFFIAADGKRSHGIELQIRTDSMPLLKTAAYNSSNSNVTLTGENLNSELSVNFNGASKNIKNTSDTELKLNLPSQAQTGYVSVTSVAGESNSLWLKITRKINGTIDSPNINVDLTKLDVSLNLDQEIYPDIKGNFSTDANLNKPTTITALLEKDESTPAVPQYGLYLSGVIFPHQNNITLNEESTALSLIWDGLGVEQLIKDSELANIYDEISNRDSVRNLKDLLKNKLIQNPQVLSDGDTELNKALTNAYKDVSQLIADSDKLKTAPEASKKLLGLFGENAEVTPEVADDIKVYEYEDSGNIAINNDTQLYLSAKITASDGTILEDHITGLSGMAGPQGYGLLFIATATKFNHPKGKNALVEVISPGIGTKHLPTQIKSLDVWNKLYFRTIIERAIWPILEDVLPLPEKDFVAILWNNAPGLVDIVVTKALNGDASGSIKSLIDLLWQDIGSVPPGPITTALAKKMGKDAAEKILAKIAAKIGAKFVPGLGQLKLAAEVAGIINKGANVTKTIYDIGNTDAVIHFNVIFPLSIEKIEPNKIIPDGTDKTFNITGSGFSKIQRGWWPFESYLKPEIRITDNDDLKVWATINSIRSDGTAMNITIPGWYLDEYTKGPLSVEINHPNDTADAKVNKPDSIEIISELELTSISPDMDGVGIYATLYGAGFSTNTSENKVTIGGNDALIYSAAETALELIIPASLDTGIHKVTAQVKEKDNWSKPSNAITYEVVQGNVSITVCDNGGAKDDAFALYIDGAYIGTMYATSYSNYCKTFTPSLKIGYHSAMLVGVEAPDNIGTYSISFSGVTNLTGSPRSGSDLTPGVQKTYNFEVVPAKELQSKTLLRTTQQSLKNSRNDNFRLEIE